MKKEIKKEQFGAYTGERTFQGTGNWGKGGINQLFIMNPATQKIKDQADEEAPSEIAHLQWILGRHMPDNLSQVFGYEDEVEVDNSEEEEVGIEDLNPDPQNEIEREENEAIIARARKNKKIHTPSLEEVFFLVSERSGTDQFYSYLSGFPRANTLEKPEDHIPDDFEQTEEEKNLTDEEESFWNGTKTLLKQMDHINPKHNDDTPHTNRVEIDAIVSPKDYVPDDQDREEPEDMYEKYINQNANKSYYMGSMKEYIDRVVKEELKIYEQ